MVTETEEKEKNDELQMVVFRLAGEEFGIEISHVREIIRMQMITQMPKAPDFIKGIINLRGQIIAVMDLSQRFSIVRAEQTDKTRIVVVEVGENIVGLVVDEVPEVMRVLQDNIDPTPQMIESKVHSDFIKGVCKIEERLVVLLNAAKILTEEELKQVEEDVKE